MRRDGSQSRSATNAAVIAVADVATWADTVVAWAAVIALVGNAYQLWQQRRDASDSAARHEKTEQDAEERHRRELGDRRRERLAKHYPALAHAAVDYLKHMAVSMQLRAESEQWAQRAEQQRDGKAKQSAMTLQQGAMAHTEQANFAHATLTTSHFAIRFDESPDFLARVDALVTKIAAWRGGPTLPLVDEVMKLIEERSDHLRQSPQ
jgi:uncharacterized membrane protein YccC